MYDKNAKLLRPAIYGTPMQLLGVAASLLLPCNTYKATLLDYGYAKGNSGATSKKGHCFCVGTYEVTVCVIAQVPYFGR